jgi:hypothetical protein
LPFAAAPPAEGDLWDRQVMRPATRATEPLTDNLTWRDRWEPIGSGSESGIPELAYQLGEFRSAPQLGGHPGEVAQLLRRQPLQ